MSIVLYRLGQAIARSRGLVVGLWLLVLAGLVGGAGLLGTQYDDAFVLPGTESQQGQDVLRERFGQTGTSAQIIFTTRSGRVTASAAAAQVSAIAKQVDAVPHASMTDPLSAASPVISDDGRSTLGQVQFAQPVPDETTLDSVMAAARPAKGSPVTTSVGGDAYKADGEPSKVPELLGLLISFLILCVTFKSLVTAGMPIVTALLGVMVTLSAVVVTSSLTTVSSTSPTLAEMLGLAVGIDYALFILSRHRAFLRTGVSPAEAMSRALATAGSAVVFAGATVVIALLGLAVARIPVLTVMGLAAAAAVTMAVLIALTLLPAIALLLGERLRPRAKRPRRPQRPQRTGNATRWVRLVTRVPLLTIVLVVGLLGLAASPGLNLALALPDNSTAPAGTPARTTYDDITRAFGPGWNTPLAVTATIITSDDPKGTVADLAGAIAKVRGVAAVPFSTPIQAADTGLVQVVPAGGQTDPSTAALVQRLRDQAPALEKKYGVQDVRVTGSTAINIDVSDRLGASLLPFAAIVIGLSLVLLTVVFRSLAVPLKATLGYLLSVGAALGAVTLVFQEGRLDAFLPGLADGPVVSFLPIFVMGVLFGLAMDYEMFLVSAMREEFVRTGDPKRAVHDGFHASATVVTAAALIMVSVFVAFIPGGSSTIKPIAFGLAVGVFVDAFIVRMTLVPAVLVLLGRWAWWLPGPLERRLPMVDVEGAALHRKVEYADLESERGALALSARALVVSPGSEPLDLQVAAGEVVSLDVADEAGRRALAEVLTGRRRQVSGDLVVAGLLLPEQRGSVMVAASVVRVGVVATSRPQPTADPLAERVRSVSLLPRRRRLHAAHVEDLAEALGPGTYAVDAALALVAGARLVVLVVADDPAPGREVHGFAERLAGRGVTVVVLGSGAEVPAPERILEAAR